jgi:hypothetical protein
METKSIIYRIFYFKAYMIVKLLKVATSREKQKNLTALKSNSNTVWFNFQTYIYIFTHINQNIYDIRLV